MNLNNAGNLKTYKNVKNIPNVIPFFFSSVIGTIDRGSMMFEQLFYLRRYLFIFVLCTGNDNE